MLLRALHKVPFLLAPMAGITDSPFRSFMRELGCGIMTTELVSATGLKHQSERTRSLMHFTADQHPIGVQIFGENLEHLAYAASEVEQLGADFVDLNFGCPVPKIVKRGAGSAVLKDLKQLQKVLHTVKSATSLPVSIKVRTGWDAHSRNADEVSHIAHNEGIIWMSVHGRTRAQAYTGKADWSYIQHIKQQSPLPIIGNGDLTSAGLACTRLQQSGCDAVMIGRGALKNPWIFQQARGQTTDVQTFTQLFARLQLHLQNFYTEQRALLQMKKLASWYSSGYPSSTEFRKLIFQLKSTSEMQKHVLDFFSPLKAQMQLDTSHEAFLMGGHG